MSNQGVPMGMSIPAMIAVMAVATDGDLEYVCMREPTKRHSQ